jgi:hypothetical protein
MRIEYKANGMQREVRDSIGRVLVKRGLAREVKAAPYLDRQMKPESEVDRLRAECDSRGIKYHHRAGVPKLRELLKD